jgi:integrase
MTTRRTRHNGEGSIYKTADGKGYRAYVWVTTPNGERRRRYISGKSRQDVHSKWSRLIEESRRQVTLPATVPTLSAYLAKWLDEVVAPNLAPLTYATYETLVRLYIAPGLGSKRVDRLTVRDVQTWLNSVARQCQCCAQGKDQRRAERNRAKCCAKGQCCNSVPSARTIRDIRTVLRSALSTAVKDELVAKNVATLVTPPRSRPRKVVPWTSDEARAFLEAARASGDPLYAAYVLILVLGLRKGEVLGLDWAAIDLENAVLSIERQLQRVRRELLLRETKTEASDNTQPLPELCVAALRARLRFQDDARRSAAEEWVGDTSGNGLVFTGRLGAPIDPRSLNRRFARQCAHAGVRQIRVHDARKTCATLLVDLEVHPRIIMRILRHADLGVTMEIYAKASSASTREALRRLGESLG